MDILACPICKAHPLRLEVEERRGAEIIRGRMTCPKCNVAYPIEGSIPNLLPQKD